MDVLRKPWALKLRPLYIIYGILFTGFYLIIFNWPPGAWSLIKEYVVFFPLGLFGALVANSTGAGGGVVFIPFFNAIGFSSMQSVATSMAIQCFGMTAGAVSWLNNITRHTPLFFVTLPQVKKMLFISGIPTIVGVLVGQYIFPDHGFEVSLIFRIFSIVFGVILFVYAFSMRKQKEPEAFVLTVWREIAIVLTCLCGGVVTAWISVGVGECLALLLFFMGMSSSLSVAMGVYVSSISVLTGVVFHLINQNVSLEVLLFAGQAALVGGYVARYISIKLGGFYLKLFFAVWIFGSGLVTK